MARTPIHPGEHLAEELKELSISAAELARQIEVPVNRITAIINTQRGVTAVVDCRSEAQDDPEALAQAGIRFLHVPTLDRHGFTYAQLQDGVEWVLDRLSDGGRAFLHCEHGVGRGPLMACAEYALLKGWACRRHQCCQLRGAETSVRRRFLGSSQTSHCMSVSVYIASQTQGTIGVG